jgi:hypothetical protein
MWSTEILKADFPLPARSALVIGAECVDSDLDADWFGLLRPAYPSSGVEKPCHLVRFGLIHGRPPPAQVMWSNSLE